MIERKRNLRAIRSKKRVKGFTGYLHDEDVIGLPRETKNLATTERSVEKQSRKEVDTRGEESVGHNLLKKLMLLSFGCR